MITLLQTAASTAQPWADLYADSTGVQAVVAFLHVGGLVAAGGFALAADRATLLALRRPEPERRAWVHELGSIHRPVLIGLAVVVLSGFLMLAADVQALLPSPVFWVKMAAFVLLLLNGRALQRAGQRLASAAPEGDGAPDAKGWRALRTASLRSAGLWFAVLFLGTLLTSAA
ncbi:MAG TPA: hypothetical protein VFJ82_12930 [Longimicrobium sp.]|nr:hypothetical protein [Longimicrobium sp.]